MTTAVNPKRRFIRFSLRTFLVILTAFAVWLGFEVNRARQTRLAILAVQEMGGHITYVHERTARTANGRHAELPGPYWLRKMLGKEYCDDGVVIFFWLKEITNEDLAQVSTHLKNLHNLQSLNLWDCPYLSDISALQELSNLDGITIHGTSISEADVDELKKALPNCKILHDSRRIIDSRLSMK